MGSAFGGRAPARIGYRAPIVIGFAMTACGFAVLAMLTPSSNYVFVAMGLLLCGGGTGLASPAGTSTVLGAVPHDRVGMGSALNDTHQQMGIALGVAVLGSLLASVYRGLLPGSVPGHASSSLAATLAYAGDRPDAASITGTAREAFTQAQSVTMVTGLGFAIAGAAVALITLRPDARIKGDEMKIGGGPEVSGAVTEEHQA